jgi:hypothetical protein
VQTQNYLYGKSSLLAVAEAAEQKILVLILLEAAEEVQAVNILDW